MGYRYSPLQVLVKRIYRRFKPVPVSPWTMGEVQDICDINLVPPQTLISFFTDCLERLRALKGEAVGDYLEFGVFNGSSMVSMHRARSRSNLGFRLFGFDAFEGLPASAEEEDGGVWKKGFYACSYEQMVACIGRKGVAENDIQWVKGWYDETLTAQKADALGLVNIGIAFIDCDTYGSSRAVLDFIAPKLQQPAILCFDDWKLNDLDVKAMGEYRAFNEWMDRNPRFKADELASYNRKSKTLLITP